MIRRRRAKANDTRAEKHAEHDFILPRRVRKLFRKRGAEGVAEEETEGRGEQVRVDVDCFVVEISKTLEAEARGFCDGAVCGLDVRVVSVPSGEIGTLMQFRDGKREEWFRGFCVLVGCHD